MLVKAFTLETGIIQNILRARHGGGVARVEFGKS
jgi:hypothetical protein